MKTILIFVLGAALAASACTSPEKRTAIGAGAGAATGAAVGGAAGGWKGAGIGAAAGAVVGGAVGNYLDKQAKELREVADTQRTENGILVKLKNDLLFDTGSDTVKPDAVSQLNDLGDILAKYRKDQIRIEGYTDNVGSNAFNQGLSQRRADAVRRILTDRGVKPEQMQIVGYGEDKPTASNTTASGRAKNRRVELHIQVPEQRQPAQEK